jgi:response regulator RpfG family c-di-GMP phosphodiesterase
MLWSRNLHALRITASLAGGIGALFLAVNLILHTGVWIPYLFLFCGSALTYGLQTLLREQRDRRELWSLLLCYGQMILVCGYACILSIQRSNHEVPATSVIVFIALLPLAVDDRPIRMFLVMLAESVVYLELSFLMKAPHAFSLDLQNVATFCIVGMVLYAVICTRNIRELHQSERIEKIQRSIITSLAAVVEERDESTGDHIQRTQDYVRRLMQRMKRYERYSRLTEDYCNNVILAAAMHDVGKIRIPDRILNKPGRLTEEEFEIMKKHSEYGAEIIRKTMGDVEEEEYCGIACNIARCHHERYDGTGYPAGLKGEEIPLEARIMALADVYDALVSERVYKKPCTGEKAREILLEGNGTQVDPYLLPLFLYCVQSEG